MDHELGQRYTKSSIFNNINTSYLFKVKVSQYILIFLELDLYKKRT